VGDKRSQVTIVQHGNAPVCTKNLNADVVMMKSAEYLAWTDDSSPQNRARDRRIFIQ